MKQIKPDKELILLAEKIIKQNQILAEAIDLNNRILKEFFYPKTLVYIENRPDIIDEITREAKMGLRENAIIDLLQDGLEK